MMRFIILIMLVILTIYPSQYIQADYESKIVEQLAQQYQVSQNRAAILFWNSEQREIGFRNAANIYPARLVKASNTPYPLKETYRDLLNVSYTLSGRRYTLEQFIDKTENRGLIVLKGDSILF